MKLVSWNVNSLASRATHVMELLDKNTPDILCIQETRCAEIDGDIVSSAAHLGYQTYSSGRSGGRNGVAIMTSLPCEPTRTDWLDFDGRVQLFDFGKFNLINVYVPCGAPVHEDPFQYKLAFLSDLRDIITELMSEKPLLVAGDFNIVSSELDSHWPLEDDSSVSHPLVRKLLWSFMITLGFKDAWRIMNHEAVEYSHYDYRGGNFQKNQGMRLDYILASKEFHIYAAEHLIDYRKRQSPSDHVPVFADVVIR